MWRRLKRIAIVFVVILGVSFAAAQLVRPERTNPATDVTQTLQAQLRTATGLVDVVDRACGDCHSNETDWTRYTQVAPLSWIVQRGVIEGRKAVNFSDWGTYSPEQRRAFLVASCEDARRGTMPVRAFLMLRPEARLSAQDVEIICAASREPAPAAATNAEPNARGAR